MYRVSMLSAVVLLAACGSDPLTVGREALEQGNHGEAVAKLRQAAAANSGDEDTVKLYQKALKTYQEDLRRPNTAVEACDGAVDSLSAITGFATPEADRGEFDLLSQALLCAARHRARKRQPDEAAKVVVRGVKLLPGFEPGSPVLVKALREPATKAARAGQVTETTAMAQILFSANEHGAALSLLDMLEAGGGDPAQIYAVLQERANKAKTSDAASGLAAGFATWHGHASEAVQWYDEIAARSSKDSGTRAKALKRYSTLRGTEASNLVRNKAKTCQVVANGKVLASKASSVPSIVAAPVKGGVLVAWVEGTKVPDQSLKVARVGADGSLGSPKTITDAMPRAAKAAAGDLMAAYAPKNRETALGMIRCGGTIELAARGAPECAWARATLGDDGAVTSQLTPIPQLGETGHMPSEDVWWNMACSNERLVHLWLADTQLMRIAWFAAGESAGDPSNMRIPGFAPWFVAAGAEESATRVMWVDMMGEGRCQILGVTIPEDREIPLSEDETNPAAEQVVESIDGRVEHMRLTKMGERYALTYYPQNGDINVRWIDAAGRAMGSAAPVVRVREDLRHTRYDASAAGDRLGMAWTQPLTEEMAGLFFQSVGPDGLQPSYPQRIAGLVNPAISPVVVGSGGNFAVVWVDRTEAETESVKVSVLNCGSTQ